MYFCAPPQQGQAEPDASTAVVIGQDTLDQIKNTTYSAAAQVLHHTHLTPPLATPHPIRLSPPLSIIVGFFAEIARN